VTSEAASAPAVRDRAVPAVVGTSRGGRRGRRLVATAASLLGVVPFGLLVTFFLVIPTLVVVIGSFLDADNRFTLANVRGLTEDVVVQAYVRSLWISAVTAVVGAVLGALLAAVLVHWRRGSALRRERRSARRSVRGAQPRVLVAGE
jgi:putative spermidine/putrescine transport system permease protein